MQQLPGPRRDRKSIDLLEIVVPLGKPRPIVGLLCTPDVAFNRPELLVTVNHVLNCAIFRLGSLLHDLTDQRAARQCHTSLICFQPSRYDRKQTRLTRAIGPGQTKALARKHIEINALQ